MTDEDGHTIKGGDNDSLHEQAISESTAKETKSILETVVQEGTGTNANVGASGAVGQDRERPRTAATPGSAAATEEVTACVWVGYADTTTPMMTLYNGGPVMGGTFPALIWASVINAWEADQSRTRNRTRKRNEEPRQSRGSGGG